jgi:flagellar hook-associated protein 3 FlgL
MGVSGVGARSQATVQSLVEMRRQMDDLQRQLGSGKKAVSYAGLGLDSGLTVSLRSQLSAISGYTDAMTTIGVRIDLAQTTLTRMSEIGRQLRTNLLNPAVIEASGQTATQGAAKNGLDELLDLLNTKAGDRYLFSGRSVDKAAVETSDHILNGDGARAGLKQLIAERNQADLGSNGLGRLVVPPLVGTTVALGEEPPGSPFGFKLASIGTNLAGATTAAPTGAPPDSMSVTLGASNPNAGETVAFTFNLPDGTTETLTLEATTSATPGANQFTIGATPADTALSLQTALANGLGKLANTSLAAASALAAADNFFNIDAGQPPLRVAGPPFASATALVAGTSANTVTWYSGELSADPARASAKAQLDSVSVSYGLRANEEGIRSLVQQTAALAAVTLSNSDPNSAARYNELAGRARNALTVQDGTQRVEDIVTDLASAQVAITSAGERQRQTKAALQGLLDSVEGISAEEVATQILALQTRLQASLQTTAILYQTSLVNYL